MLFDKQLHHTTESPNVNSTSVQRPLWLEGVLATVKVHYTVKLATTVFSYRQHALAVCLVMDIEFHRTRLEEMTKSPLAILLLFDGPNIGVHVNIWLVIVAVFKALSRTLLYKQN